MGTCSMEEGGIEWAGSVEESAIDFGSVKEGGIEWGAGMRDRVGSVEEEGIEWGV
jgi:hypothetical protein